MFYVRVRFGVWLCGCSPSHLSVTGIASGVVQHWGPIMVAMTMLMMIGLDPQKLISSFGLVGVFAMVFAESGLLIGFFLPGDSLLFTAGLLSSLHSRVFNHSIALICVVCLVAAVLGDQVGFQFGRRVGPALFRREDSRLFRRSHLDRAQEFFDRHGPKTVLLARFVPVVRTFSPVLAGVGAMRHRVFTTYNLVGGLIWGVGVPLLGFGLGRQFPSLKDRLDLVAVGIIAASLVPVAVEALRQRSHEPRED